MMAYARFLEKVSGVGLLGAMCLQVLLWLTLDNAENDAVAAYARDLLLAIAVAACIGMLLIERQIRRHRRRP